MSKKYQLFQLGLSNLTGILNATLFMLVTHFPHFPVLPMLFATCYDRITGNAAHGLLIWVYSTLYWSKEFTCSEQKPSEAGLMGGGQCLIPSNNTQALGTRLVRIQAIIQLGFFPFFDQTFGIRITTWTVQTASLSQQASYVTLPNKSALQNRS